MVSMEATKAIEHLKAEISRINERLIKLKQMKEEIPEELHDRFDGQFSGEIEQLNSDKDFYYVFLSNASSELVRSLTREDVSDIVENKKDEIKQSMGTIDSELENYRKEFPEDVRLGLSASKLFSSERLEKVYRDYETNPVIKTFVTGISERDLDDPFLGGILLQLMDEEYMPSYDSIIKDCDESCKGKKPNEIFDFDFYDTRNFEKLNSNQMLALFSGINDEAQRENRDLSYDEIKEKLKEIICLGADNKGRYEPYVVSALHHDFMHNEFYQSVMGKYDEIKDLFNEIKLPSGSLFESDFSNAENIMLRLQKMFFPKANRDSGCLGKEILCLVDPYETTFADKFKRDGTYYNYYLQGQNILRERRDFVVPLYIEGKLREMKYFEDDKLREKSKLQDTLYMLDKDVETLKPIIGRDIREKYGIPYGTATDRRFALKVYYSTIDEAVLALLKSDIPNDIIEKPANMPSFSNALLNGNGFELVLESAREHLEYDRKIQEEYYPQRQRIDDEERELNEERNSIEHPHEQDYKGLFAKKKYKQAEKEFKEKRDQLASKKKMLEAEKDELYEKYGFVDEFGYKIHIITDYASLIEKTLSISSDLVRKDSMPKFKYDLEKGSIEDQFKQYYDDIVEKYIAAIISRIPSEIRNYNSKSDEKGIDILRRCIDTYGVMSKIRYNNDLIRNRDEVRSLTPEQLNERIRWSKAYKDAGGRVVIPNEGLVNGDQEVSLEEEQDGYGAIDGGRSR